MDLGFVYIQMDPFIWGTGLMINRRAMEGKYLKMVTIILDFGSKENTMDKEF